jgi:hypothetical protein
MQTRPKIECVLFINTIVSIVPKGKKDKLLAFEKYRQSGSLAYSFVTFRLWKVQHPKMGEEANATKENIQDRGIRRDPSLPAKATRARFVIEIFLICRCQTVLTLPYLSFDVVLQNYQVMGTRWTLTCRRWHLLTSSTDMQPFMVLAFL